MHLLPQICFETHGSLVTMRLMSRTVAKVRSEGKVGISSTSVLVASTDYLSLMRCFVSVAEFAVFIEKVQEACWLITYFCWDHRKCDVCKIHAALF